MSAAPTHDTDSDDDDDDEFVPALGAGQRRL